MMKKTIYVAGVMFCALLSVVSFCHVARYYAAAHKSAEEFAYLAGLARQEGESAEGTPGGKTPEAGGRNRLDKYKELCRMNGDMAGWISIEGTKISYPVMHTPGNPDYYLDHSFEKEYSAYGVPFAAGHCSPLLPSDNIIIYGHHMRNGTMFSGLEDYEDKDFYERHKTICFDTLAETGKYEVMAVFKTTVYDQEGFRFYLFANAETGEEFKEYVEKCKELSLYDTGVGAEYGDKLVTLSTCEYSHKNGRFVVVAKRIGK